MYGKTYSKSYLHKHKLIGIKGQPINKKEDMLSLHLNLAIGSCSRSGLSCSWKWVVVDSDLHSATQEVFHLAVKFLRHRLNVFIIFLWVLIIILSCRCFGNATGFDCYYDLTKSITVYFCSRMIALFLHRVNLQYDRRTNSLHLV